MGDDKTKEEPETAGPSTNKLVQQQRDALGPGADRTVKSHTKDRYPPQPGDRSIDELDGSDPRDSLTPQQRRVMIRLARGEDLKSAATRERVHPERARRWLDTPRFARAYLRERAQPVLLSTELQDALDRIEGR